MWWNFLFKVTLLTVAPTLVLGGYPCLCSYQPETRVFISRSTTSTVLGYLYEFDCKPTYPLDSNKNSDFVVIQFRGQIGYIENVAGVLSIEACLGAIPSTDRVLNTTSNQQHTSTPDLSATSSPETTETTPQKVTSTLPVEFQTTMSRIPTSTTSATTLTPTTTQHTTVQSTTLRPTTSTQQTTVQLTTLRVTTTSAATTTHALDCPKDWLHYSNSCYLIIPQLKSFDDAMSHCSRHHSHLAHITSPGEQHAVASFLTNENHQASVWIGGVCTERTHCQWIFPNKQQTIGMTYTHWASGQPNNHGGRNCISLGSDHWKDKSCTNTRSFICERSTLHGPALIG